MKKKILTLITIITTMIIINCIPAYANTEWFSNYSYSDEYDRHLNIQYNDPNTLMGNGCPANFSMVLECSNDTKYFFARVDSGLRLFYKGSIHVFIGNDNDTYMGDYLNCIRDYMSYDYTDTSTEWRKANLSGGSSNIYKDFNMQMYINETGIDLLNLPSLTLDSLVSISDELNNGTLTLLEAHVLCGTKLLDGYTLETDGSISYDSTNYIKGENLPNIKNLEYFWPNSTYVYMNRATDRCNFDKEDYLSMNIENIQEGEQYYIEIEVTPDFMCMKQKDYLIGGKSDWKSYYGGEQDSISKGSCFESMKLKVPIEENRIIIQSGIYELYDYYLDCLKQITDNDTHVVIEEGTLSTESTIWYLEYIKFQMRIIRVDGDNRYFSNWYEIIAECINRYNYAEFEEIGEIDRLTGKGESQVDISQDSEFTTEHDNVNQSTYEEDLSQQGIMESLKNGFGLIGDNGLIAFFSSTFSYIPAWIWTLIGSGVALSIAVIIFKIIRGV